MALAALSSSQAGSSIQWGQIQQQAQRNAAQAEQRAQALQGQAREAQVVADRAQENARSLQSESNRAQGEAGRAKQALAGVVSSGKTQIAVQLSNSDQPVGKVVNSESTMKAAPSLAPVVNVFGQVTGSLVNVTA